MQAHSCEVQESSDSNFGSKTLNWPGWTFPGAALWFKTLIIQSSFVPHRPNHLHCGMRLSQLFLLSSILTFTGFSPNTFLTHLTSYFLADPNIHKRALGYLALLSAKNIEKILFPHPSATPHTASVNVQSEWSVTSTLLSLLLNTWLTTWRVNFFLSELYCSLCRFIGLYLFSCYFPSSTQSWIDCLKIDNAGDPRWWRSKWKLHTNLLQDKSGITTKLERNHPE